MKIFFLFPVFFFSFLSHASYKTFKQAEEVAQKAQSKHPKAFVSIWYVPSTNVVYTENGKSYGVIGVPAGGNYNITVHQDYDGNSGADVVSARRGTAITDLLWKVLAERYYVSVVTGTIPHMTFDSYVNLDQGKGDVRENLVAVTNLGNLNYRSFVRAFAGCTHLTKVLHEGSPVGGRVEDVSEMFAHIDGLEKVTPKLRLYSVENARSMFEGTNFANDGFINLERLFSYAKNLEDMSRMFYQSNARYVYGLWGWNTSRVKNMNRMFYQSNIKNYAGIGAWNVSNVENMSHMFATNSHFSPLRRIRGKWNTGNVKYMEGTFAGIHFPQGSDNLGLDTSNVRYMNSMFAGSQNPPTRGFGTEEVRNMDGMYKGAELDGSEPSIGLHAFDTWDLGRLQSASQFLLDAEVINNPPTFEGSIMEYLYTNGYNLSNFYASFLKILEQSGPNNFAVELQDAGICNKSTPGAKMPGWTNVDCKKALDGLGNRGYEF